VWVTRSAARVFPELGLATVLDHPARPASHGVRAAGDPGEPARAKTPSGSGFHPSRLQIERDHSERDGLNLATKG
jgi:hypothetical protein